MSTGTPTLSKTVNRRDALWLLLTSGAALFGGGSLTWGLQRDEAVRSAETRANSLAQTLANSGGRIAELSDTMRAAETEIVRLATALAESQGLVAQKPNELAGAQSQLGAVQIEVESLRAQLEESQVQRISLAGLVGMLESLDNIGLDDIVRTGLTALAGAWAGLGGLALLLQSAEEFARGLLDEFDETISGLREKVLRGGKLLSSIRLDVERIETASAQAVLSVGPLFEPVTQFATYVIEQIPFDVSAPFENTMGLLRRLLNSVPRTIRNLEQLMVQPVERYLGQNEQGWNAALTTPLREQVLAPVSEFLDGWGQADMTFNEKVLSPTNAALEKRAAAFKEIADYKTQHHLN